MENFKVASTVRQYFSQYPKIIGQWNISLPDKILILVCQPISAILRNNYRSWPCSQHITHWLFFSLDELVDRKNFQEPVIVDAGAGGHQSNGIVNRILPRIS